MKRISDFCSKPWCIPAASARMRCLVVAGEGPASAGLQTRAGQLGLAGAVRFIGYLDRRVALPDCYAAADVFAFASRTETQGLVLLEAMAAGLPVVALSEMGTSDILDSGRGSISPPAIPQVFGETLAHVLNHPSAWRHLGDDAACFAREWSDVAMAGRMAALYRQMAGVKFAPDQPLTAPRSKFYVGGDSLIRRARIRGRPRYRPAD